MINIPVTGTIGVLLKAKECGLITAIAPILQDLRNKSSWINNNFLEKAITLAGEQ
jgi:predicted nucleic acid-binding protein